MKRTNYLNNKDILSEIHKSKTTYCSFSDQKYHQFDITHASKHLRGYGSASLD